MQAYGGKWTVLKKQILNEYLTMYSQALKNQKFNKWYIDAFAGSGYHEFPLEETNPLFDHTVDEDILELRLGSARLALQHPFDSYIFIEKSLGNFQELEKLKTEFPEKNIHCIQGDANVELKQICAQLNKRRRNLRGVVFLDPFGLQLEWETLNCIARTEICDMWYLFPTMGINRMLTRNGHIPDSWENRLNLIMGSTSWKKVFYEQEEQQKTFEFILNTDISLLRKKETPLKNIEEYVNIQLSSIFCYVSPKPISLYNRHDILFSLFFAASNRNPKAVNLASKFGNYILKKYGERT